LWVDGTAVDTAREDTCVEEGVVEVTAGEGAEFVVSEIVFGEPCELFGVEGEGEDYAVDFVD
jgi:hypothetical protein